MCTVALQIAGTLFSAVAQKQQADAQAAVYNAQAQQADQNAKIANRQQESVADAYAEKQNDLRQRMRVAAGQQAATYGARSLEGGAGSALDVLAGTYEGYQRDTRNLLSNQRNDVWGKQVEETNYTNQANQYRASADNASTAGNMGMLTTLVSGAATTSAYMDKWKKPSTLKIGG
ncbi:MAG: hypothetical protein VB133_07495 [Anaeromusa sp.]|uniref:virion core protein, T7 gp14 family n=1 Tax=Anaeromusa sp. TaxID=1872520 RepID=UPI002B1F3260|nr:hypothetical protein [Anaeromusa sp.]MEA4834960.1 hypothetical protein [Anaeromusa sp.]